MSAALALKALPARNEGTDGLGLAYLENGLVVFDHSAEALASCRPGDEVVVIVGGRMQIKALLRLDNKGAWISEWCESPIRGWGAALVPLVGKVI